MDMTAKTAIITGASQGIGADTARVFANAGAQVILMARSEDKLDTLAREIGPNAHLCAGDVANPDDIAKAVKLAMDKTGRIDVLINNAGLIEPIAHFAESDPAAWAHVIDVNLKGVYFAMRAVTPIMETQKGGTIINVSSGAATHAIEGWSHYCTSKAAVAMLTRCADKELRDHGLRVMGMSPGTVATDMQVQIKDSGINPVSQLDWSDHIPAEWPARAMLWMCSPDADDLIGEEVSLRDEVIRKRVGLE